MRQSEDAHSESHMPAAIPVKGRSVERVCCDFVIDSIAGEPSLHEIGGPVWATVHVKLAHRKRWVSLVRFNLRTDRVQLTDRVGSPELRVYRNNHDI